MSRSSMRLLFATLSCFSLVHYAFALNFGFPYGQEKVRGVNLGGWLVLEPWITPSIFENTGDERIVDEWTFGQFQDRNTALQTLRRHWDTWITEQDFAEIAAAGLNHVRLPIGYWAFEVAPGEPYIQGQLPYLNRAIEWASRHNLNLIVDLHGAPGSQNGFDNSGQRKASPEWQTRQSYVDRTNAIIRRIADQVKDMSGVVSAIAPLNEPAGFSGQQMLQVTRQFWLDSYGSIRYPYGSDRQSNTVVMIHDAFQPLSYWDGFMLPPGHQGVILDTHIYQVFSDEMNHWSEERHIQAACSRFSDISNAQLWVVVGEWSPASTDCAKWLNGRGVGARYDGSRPGSPRVGSCNGKSGAASSFSASYRRFLRQFWEAQTSTYENAGEGWIQWTWKTENAAEWSYQAGLQNGWIPRNPTERMYPNICG